MPVSTLIKLPAVLLTAAVAAVSQNASPVPVVPAADFARPATPQMGINLENVTDYARSLMFVDAIKSGRHFGSAGTPWDESATLDADGWPTSDAGQVVMAGNIVPAGDYLFSCTGSCTPGLVATSGTVKDVTYSALTNTTTATISVAAGNENLMLSFNNTYNGVQNIRLIRPGYGRNTTQVFTSEFLAAIKPFTTLRLMDFVRTNETDVSEWADRTTPAWPVQSSARGAAWEYGIQLANATHKDLWINIPDRASDDYIRQLARLFRDTLDPTLSVYLEYSNEVWNFGFGQAVRNLQDAQAEVAAGNKTLNDSGTDTNAYYWAWKRVPKRLLEISAIFRGVYGDPAFNQRFRPVLASQSANPFLTRMQLEFIERYYGTPSKFIYGLAGAPYLTAGNGAADASGATVDSLFANTDVNQWVRGQTMEYLALARYYRLHHLCYEGGVCMEGWNNLDVKVAFNRDPRVAQVMNTYFTLWYAQGGETFNYFNLASPWNGYGTWGLSDDIHVAGPKRASLDALAAAPTPAQTLGSKVPGVVLASAPDSRNGGQAAPLPDGTYAMGYIKAGDCFDYVLNVQNTGNYNVTLETAGTAPASVQVLLSGTSLGNVTTLATGDWFTFKSTKPLTVRLNKGQVDLRLKVGVAGLNIKSVTFKQTQ